MNHSRLRTKMNTCFAQEIEDIIGRIHYSIAIPEASVSVHV